MIFLNLIEYTKNTMIQQCDNYDQDIPSLHDKFLFVHVDKDK